MVNSFVLIVFFGLAETDGKALDHVVFPWRAECDYAAEKINKEVPGAKAFCFDIQVAGDRREGTSGLSQAN
jgi:hypothetical protein